MDTPKQQVAQLSWLDLIFVGREINKLDVSGKKYVKQLLNLCITTKLRILNGITRGDFQRNLTYIGYQGCSTFSPWVRNNLNTANT